VSVYTEGVCLYRGGVFIQRGYVYTKGVCFYRRGVFLQRGYVYTEVMCLLFQVSQDSEERVPERPVQKVRHSGPEVPVQ